MSSAPRHVTIRDQIKAGAIEAEQDFHALVNGLARRALARGEAAGRVRERLIAYFLAEPTFRAADLYEQERVFAGLQGAIDEGLALGPFPSMGPAAPQS